MSERASRHALYRVGREQLLDFRKLAVRHFPFCQWCRAKLTYKTATVDHLRPVALGGTDDLSNLSLACPKCNCKKDCIWREGLRPRYGPEDWKRVLEA